MNMEDFRQKGSQGKFGPGIRPFGKRSLSAFSAIVRELKPVFGDNRFRRILWLGMLNTSCIFILLKWCKATKSMGLQVYSYLILFDILCLCICTLSIWVEQKKPNQSFTFGYERFEVLAVFLATSFAGVSSFFIAKESFVRWIHQSQIHTGRLFPGVILAFVCHLTITYSMKSRALNHVICASSSSWLQSHVADVSQSLCRVIPGLSIFLLPRVNPFVLIGWTAGGTLLFAQLLIDVYNYHAADSMAAICIAFMICVTMFPMSAYSGKILLQSTPPHIVDLLDKCLREASTLDGVLEFRNEHFWLLGFDKIVGSVHVRIRRDANEQLVLTHLLDKLSNLVADITIQVFKDEWAWSSSTFQVLNESFLKFPPTSLPSVTMQEHNMQYISDSKGPFVAYNSPATSSNHLKLPYQGSSPSINIKSPPYQPQFAPYNSRHASFPDSLPKLPSLRPSQTEHHSVSISIPNSTAAGESSNPNTKNNSLPNTYQATSNISKISKTDLNSDERSTNLSINPLFSETPDFLQSCSR